MHEFQDDFEKTDCPYCAELFFAVSLEPCLICDKVERACQSCLTKHRATHTQAEIQSFKHEMLDERQLTPRERINQELKQQILMQARTLCKLIDDQESLVKKYERQCTVLAQEVDRLRPAS